MASRFSFIFRESILLCKQFWQVQVPNDMICMYVIMNVSNINTSQEYSHNQYMLAQKPKLESSFTHILKMRMRVYNCHVIFKKKIHQKHTYQCYHKSWNFHQNSKNANDSQWFRNKIWDNCSLDMSTCFDKFWMRNLTYISLNVKYHSFVELQEPRGQFRNL